MSGSERKGKERKALWRNEKSYRNRASQLRMGRVHSEDVARCTTNRNGLLAGSAEIASDKSQRRAARGVIAGRRNRRQYGGGVAERDGTRNLRADRDLHELAHANAAGRRASHLGVRHQVHARAVDSAHGDRRRRGTCAEIGALREAMC